jgi:hypothetical protein
MYIFVFACHMHFAAGEHSNKGTELDRIIIVIITMMVATMTTPMTTTITFRHPFRRLF